MTMPCVVITREGWGDIFLFETKRKALVHPVTQPGIDAVADCPEDLTDLYNHLEWGRLMKLAGVWDKQIEDALPTMKGPEERHVRRSTARKVWDALVALATSPPQTYEALCAMVARNRTQPVESYRPMGDTNTSNTEAEAKEKRTRAPRIDPETKISFLKDDEGKLFGSDNNPYRVGSGRHERFSQLKEGMTVGEAAELGIKAMNLDPFVENGHIQLIAP